MITRRVRIQLIVFGVIALLGVGYLGSSYVGVPQMMGLRGYELTVVMPRTGGIFSNGEVTYRGVPIGRIGEMEATADGVEVTVRITNEDVQIPTDVDAVVRNRSAIGEQYIDLRPIRKTALVLGDRDRIGIRSDQLPLALEELLTNLVAFNESVPTDDLKTVVDESYLASLDAGDDLGSLLEASSAFAGAASENIDTTIALIKNAEPVLTTQVDIADAVRSTSADMRAIADALAASDTAVRQIITSTPGAAREFQRLLEEVGGPFARLLGNLLTINGVIGERSPELDHTLANVPWAVSYFQRALGPNGLAIGLTTNFSDPRPCTAGYRQRIRDGLATGDAPLAASRGCTKHLPRGAD